VGGQAPVHRRQHPPPGRHHGTSTARKIAIAGTGESGAKDGAFSVATFNDPQGMGAEGRHAVRRRPQESPDSRIGSQKADGQDGSPAPASRGRDRDGDGPALKTGLNSPWDVLIDGNLLYVAMGGAPSDLGDGSGGRTASPAYARQTAARNIRDGLAGAASEFAQPSGLCSDGKDVVGGGQRDQLDPRGCRSRAAGRCRRSSARGCSISATRDGVGDRVRLQARRWA